MAFRSLLLLFAPLLCARYEPKTRSSPSEELITLRPVSARQLPKPLLLTSFKIDRGPGLFLYPVWFDAIVFSNRNVHVVTSIYDIQSAVSRIGRINGKEDSQVLDVPNMRIGG